MWPCPKKFGRILPAFNGEWTHCSSGDWRTCPKLSSLACTKGRRRGCSASM
ncbi:hypothetical protein DPMN_031059 [Dreissena polymorpha]|uniref:Uncharacterized protein n=1 Tax=Dreissena polymorpha TaxID=45954 RepID=A0A9D4LZ98_DREPO|nr:hypothetical protein DPMN_031059 [Dreissena polymorpha]